MSQLVVNDTASIRRDALGIFRAGIEAADPYQAVKRHLTPSLFEKAEKIHIIAFGKAACAMTQAALDILPAHLLADKAIVVTNYENVRQIDHSEVIGAGHPLPDTAGLKAAQMIAERIRNAQENELVLTLISGGGSALIPYPAGSVGLAEKIAVTELLLASGSTIDQINCVRKHLSVLKGAGLARLAAPARLHALILSDVLGDDLSAIASGPTVADPSTYNDAVEILKNFNIWNQVPDSIRRHLEQGIEGDIAETPKPGDAIFRQCTHTLIGSNIISIDAMQQAACSLNYETLVYSDRLCGESREAAEQLLHYANSLNTDRSLALLAGGETTVTLTGSGRGGRNQEMALAFALAVERQSLNCDWAFLSGGTDGIDGPTDAAGAIVDRHTISRMTEAGLDPADYLQNNDAYNALKASGDLLMTGATGTNVADLQALLIRPATKGH